MTQSQREALLDLLLLSTFVDSHQSLKEDEALQAVIESMGWESSRSRDVYLLTGISAARAAGESEESTAKFTAARVLPFTDATSRQAAVSAIRGVLSNDGIVDAERSFLNRVEQAFA